MTVNFVECEKSCNFVPWISTRIYDTLVAKGNKYLSITRRFVSGKDYIKMFMKRFLK